MKRKNVAAIESHNQSIIVAALAPLLSPAIKAHRTVPHHSSKPTAGRLTSVTTITDGPQLLLRLSRTRSVRSPRVAQMPTYTVHTYFFPKQPRKHQKFAPLLRESTLLLLLLECPFSFSPTPPPAHSPPSACQTSR
ncbi:unnamed protein product [Ectocarpus sp. 4 AP-2014]